MNPGEFKKAVQHRLIDMGQTQTWLIREVEAKTGLYIDSSYLSKIFTGKNSNPKIIAAIREILDLPEE